MTITDPIFKQAFENSPIGMALVGVNGSILQCNAVFATMLGLSSSEVEGKAFAEFTHPDDLDLDLAQFRDVLDGKINGYRMFKRYFHASGATVDVHLSVTVVRDSAGVVELFVSQVEDITEQRATERRLREDAAQIALAMNAMRGGFWHMDLVTGTFETSLKLAQFVEPFRADTFGLAAYCEHIEPDDLPAADLSALIEGRIDSHSTEYRLRTFSGVRLVRCDRKLVRSEDGEPEKIVGVVTDINDERERQRISQREAETDPLTGLLNRRGFNARFGGAMPGARGVLVIDLDRFKQVNDNHGHAAGDAVLLECARRILRQTRPGDAVSRMGGDEFVVALSGIGELALADVAARITRSLDMPMLFGPHRLYVGASIGMAWDGQGTTEPYALLEAADEALYRNKALRRRERAASGSHAA